MNILSGLVAGNFSAYWLGMAMMGSDGAWPTGSARRCRAGVFLENSGAVFAFGLVAFGFLGMGPVTIAVDSLRSGDGQRAIGLRAEP